MSNKVIIGRFGTPHGVRGDIRVHSFTQPFSNILEYQPWIVTLNDELLDLKISQHRQHNDQFLVHVEGYDDRDKVRALTNANIEVDREILPKLSESEHYWLDLIGLEVINKESTSLGTIDHLLETGSNDVIVAVKDDKECYIPYLDDVILDINHETGTMKVDWEPIE